MNKSVLVEKIVAALVEERSGYLAAARAAHAEATHEQSKADNKYDTRGLEAAYLARGQSRQVADVELSIQQFERMMLRSFGPKDPIDLGAVVELKTAKTRTFYFLGPRAGGTEVLHEKNLILVITPQSPLGQQLMGKLQGSRLKLEIAGSRSDYEVVAVD